MTSPCKDCDRRTVTCHGFCDEYKSWAAWNEAEKDKRRRAKENDHMMLSQERKKRYWAKLKWK